MFPLFNLAGRFCILSSEPPPNKATKVHTEPNLSDDDESSTEERDRRAGVVEQHSAVEERVLHHLDQLLLVADWRRVRLSASPTLVQLAVGQVVAVAAVDDVRLCEI